MAKMSATEIGYMPIPPLSNALNMLPIRSPIAVRPPGYLAPRGGSGTPRLSLARTTPCSSPTMASEIESTRRFTHFGSPLVRGVAPLHRMFRTAGAGRNCPLGDARCTVRRNPPHGRSDRVCPVPAPPGRLARGGIEARQRGGSRAPRGAARRAPPGRDGGASARGRRRGPRLRGGGGVPRRGRQPLGIARTAPRLPRLSAPPRPRRAGGRERPRGRLRRRLPRPARRARGAGLPRLGLLPGLPARLLEGALARVRRPLHAARLPRARARGAGAGVGGGELRAAALRARLLALPRGVARPRGLGLRARGP